MVALAASAASRLDSFARVAMRRRGRAGRSGTSVIGGDSANDNQIIDPAAAATLLDDSNCIGCMVGIVGTIRGSEMTILHAPPGKRQYGTVAAPSVLRSYRRALPRFTPESGHCPPQAAWRFSSLFSTGFQKKTRIGRRAPARGDNGVRRGRREVCMCAASIAARCKTWSVTIDTENFRPAANVNASASAALGDFSPRAFISSFVSTLILPLEVSL
jgi:hypothetical protein